ncbi:MAG: PorP/SprF family type IX secretion system membrane protein [Bacteroidota bacterium]
MKKSVIIFIITLFPPLFWSGAGGEAHAQDVHFSQYDETPLLLNPANAGVQHDLRIVTNYKNQWQSVGASYKTFAVSADAKFLVQKKHQLGLGIDFFNDKSGDASLKSNQAGLSLSGIINIDKKNLISAGIMFGYAQRSISIANLSWGSQYNGMNYDANVSSGEPVALSSFAYPDMGAGIQYSYGADEPYITLDNSRKINIGASVFHPQEPVYSFYADQSQKLHAKIILHGDASIGINNKNIILKPSCIFFQQGASRQINGGLMVQYILKENSKSKVNKSPAAISLGGFYRAGDAVISTIKFELSHYSIGFSYDINFSSLKKASNSKGGFEISLRFITPNAFQNRSHARFS